MLFCMGVKLESLSQRQNVGCVREWDPEDDIWAWGGGWRGETEDWMTLINEQFFLSAPPPTKHYSDDHIRKNCMRGACTTYEEEDRCVQDTWKS